MASNIKKVLIVLCIIMLFSQVHAQGSEIQINLQPTESEVSSGYISDDGEWEIELASGNYDVTISVGEAVYSSVYSSVYGYEVKLETTNINSLWDTARTIAPKYKLYNTGDSSIELQDVKIRYYYSIEGEREQKFWCPWASVNKDNVTGTFVEKEIPALASDYYFEVGFTEEAGFLAPDQNIKMHTVVAKEYEMQNNWFDSIFMKIIEFLNLDKLEEYIGKYIGDINNSDDEVSHEDILYNQTNDYSFNSTGGLHYTEWDKVAVFIDGILVWGDAQIFGKPQHLTTDAEQKQITLSWDALEGATNYDIEADGEIITNIEGTTYVHDGIQPGTLHKYRIRGKSPAITGEWSPIKTEITLLGIPSNVTTKPTERTIKSSWKAVEGATSYDIEVDGEIITDVENTTYVHSNLFPGTRHAYRVRAKTAVMTGEWSPIVTEITLLGIPSNVITEPTEKTINSSWELVEGATGYDIEVDGTIIDNGININYTHTNLVPGTQHAYRMRAKNSIITGEWSSIITEVTLLGIPSNVTTEPTETTINITWESVEGATSYEIEADGEIIPHIEGTTYKHSDLLPGTPYTYRIRAKTNVAIGEWSSTVTEITLLDIPSNVTTEPTETTINITWESVEGATSYDIEADGTIIDNGSTTGYIHSDLLPGTEHTYRVRAKTEFITGEWTTIITKWTLPDIPQNIQTSVTDSSISLEWDDVIGVTGYEIEIIENSKIVDNGLETQYTHSGLGCNTHKSYRIRAKNSSGVGKWSRTIKECTLVDSPKDITAEVSGADINVNWKKVNGATGYDIQINGKLIKNVSRPYIHADVEIGTEYTYKVRAKNFNGAGKWSLPVTAERLGIIYEFYHESGETFDILLTASNIKNSSEYTYTLEYDPKQIEVVDLCIFTSVIETNIGVVGETGIEIIEYNSKKGIIKYTLNKDIDNSEKWTGTTNGIKFRSKTNEKITVLYISQ